MSERKELAARLRAMATEDGLAQREFDTLRAAADLLDPPARGRTKRIRIAVAMDSRGVWVIAGWDGATDEAMRREVASPDDRITFIEAPVPLPEETTVEGEVS